MSQEQETVSTFVQSAMKSEYLDADTEQELARAWRDDRDEHAMHRLVASHMRLAISMAMRFRRYGAATGDLIQEANMGLMKAADRFDPDRGVRFSTYATWWIRASIQGCVMRDWSLVRTGSTSAQKALFFNLKRVQQQIEQENVRDGKSLDSAQLQEQIATEIGVSVQEVALMQGRLSGRDSSLNAPQGGDPDGREWLDVLEDDTEQAADQIERRTDHSRLCAWLSDSMTDLTEREKQIVRQRKLSETPSTLEALGQALGISKERVRQLEAGAVGKMRASLERNHPEARALIT